MSAKTRTSRKSAVSARTHSPGIMGGRIRTRRKELNLSLEELADRTGLTASFLSLVERDHNSPSLESLWRISDALEVPPFFFSQMNGQNPVVRRNERVRITFPPGDLTCELLVSNLRNRLEMFIARVHPSAGNIARTPKYDSEECIYVLEGSLRVRLNDTDYVLNQGDSIHFYGNALREISASGKRESVFLSAITPPIL